ncbi:cytochrome c556 [Peribacillus deserti]|uniref:Cytochrome c556 n=1 Tax=Peribacillus deserti TaxID=673318 RepID=A0ABS2QMC4_9BACI|nr:hypothetical protein [Peribacillus deserti]MBM7694257.1 cytochrome c556 [Peribacillus deserti]
MKQMWGALIAAAMLTGCGQAGEEAARNTEGAAQKVKEESKKAVNEIDKKTQPAQDKVKQEADTANLKEKTKQAVDQVKSTMNNAKTKAEKKILEPGEHASVEQDAFLAETEGEYEKLYQFIKINDYDGVSNMVNEKKAVELKKGTKVKIVSREAIRAKVLVEDTQKKGFIPTSLLQPSK